jgi:hypothetical protein
METTLNTGGEGKERDGESEGGEGKGRGEGEGERGEEEGSKERATWRRRQARWGRWAFFSEGEGISSPSSHGRHFRRFAIMHILSPPSRGSVYPRSDQ